MMDSTALLVDSMNFNPSESMKVDSTALFFQEVQDMKSLPWAASWAQCQRPRKTPGVHFSLHFMNFALHS